jgi:AmmeMemoRadiSam system protein A
MTGAGDKASSGGLGSEDQKVLLQLARSTIEAAVRGIQPPPPPGGGAFAERRGAFVTLRSGPDRKLRGCIGVVEATRPVAKAVAEAATEAALHDPRFPPVRPAELGQLHIEISLLSPFAPIRPDEVEVGIHGLVIYRGAAAGLLLPQVPVEQGWDRGSYLDGLCRKAGLAAGDWRRPDVQLFGFTAEVFGEEDGRV